MEAMQVLLNSLNSRGPDEMRVGSPGLHLVVHAWQIPSGKHTKSY
jgi:hypothetical protein